MNPNLLFAGLEFGVYFTVDGGSHWVQLGAFRPRRRVASRFSVEKDLVVATFGRSMHLDDYCAEISRQPRLPKKRGSILRRLSSTRSDRSWPRGAIQQRRTRRMVRSSRTASDSLPPATRSSR